MKNTLAKKLADFTHDLSFDRLPPAVVEKAQISIIDAFASAFSGYELKTSQIALKITESLGKKGKSTIWINGRKADIFDAAWTNCMLVHCALHDDMQSSSVGHMGSMIIPTALAIAEEMGSSGQDLICAMVCGYEVAGRVAAKNSGTTIVANGFRGSPVFGTLAAATVAGKLLGLNSEEMRNAICCAASFSCGLLEPANSGTEEWRFENGNALRGGIMAAFLAKQGLHTAAEALEGECGFYASFGGKNLREKILASMDEITNTLGKEYEISKNLFKPFATCGYNQIGVEVISRIATENNIAFKDIVSVKVKVSPENKAYPGGDESGPFTSFDQALLSKPFSVGAAIKYRDMQIEQVQHFEDPDVLEVAKRVDTEAVAGMGDFDFSVEIVLSSGKVITGNASLMDITNYYLNKERAIAKFKKMSSNMMSEDTLSKVAQAIFQLDEIADVSKLTSLFKYKRMSTK